MPNNGKTDEKKQNILPNSKDSEDNILIRILSDPKLFPIVQTSLFEKDFFFDPENNVIYGTMMKLYVKGRPINWTSVKEEVVKDDLFTAARCDEIFSRYFDPSAMSSDLEESINNVREKYIYRELIKKARDIVRVCETQENIEAILDRLFKSFTQISGLRFAEKGEQNLGDYLVKFKRDIIEKILSGEFKPTFVPTGFDHLDKKLGGGFTPGSFVILGARASVGKTSFALNMLRNFSTGNKKSLFFSLEQPADQVLMRFFSMELDLPFNKIVNLRDFSDMNERYQSANRAELINQAAETIHSYSENIRIVDNSNLDVNAIKNAIRKHKNEQNTDIVVIDYLQFIKPPQMGDRMLDSRIREITIISRELKDIARETGTCVIALSQLSRNIEQRDKKERMPRLSDLRDSGALEQDADVVLFLYEKPEREAGEDEEEVKNRPETSVNVMIGKNRNGETGIVSMKFRKTSFTFTEE